MFKMDSKTYDTLKYIAQIVLPALATLYAGVAKIWGIPYGVEIPGTIMLLDAFLGALLMISSKEYSDSGRGSDGTRMIDQSGDVEKWLFALNGTPLEEIAQKARIMLKVDGNADLSGEDVADLYEGKH